MLLGGLINVLTHDKVSTIRRVHQRRVLIDADFADPEDLGGLFGLPPGGTYNGGPPAGTAEVMGRDAHRSAVGVPDPSNGTSPATRRTWSSRLRRHRPTDYLARSLTDNSGPNAPAVWYATSWTQHTMVRR